MTSYAVGFIAAMTDRPSRPRDSHGFPKDPARPNALQAQCALEWQFAFPYGGCAAERAPISTSLYKPNGITACQTNHPPTVLRMVHRHACAAAAGSTIPPIRA